MYRWHWAAISKSNYSPYDRVTDYRVREVQMAYRAFASMTFKFAF